MNNKKMLFSIFLVVFIDLLGFSLILPLLPFYAETFGASPVIIGFLVAAYAAAQFIGAPILGRLSDRYGRKPLLLASIFGSILGFLLLGVANSLWVIFLARIIDGITGGNISVAQAYISDITDEKNRARGLGLIGAAFGLGFIIGPALGGLLSQWGYSTPAFVAAGLSTINFLSIIFWLPESLTSQRRAEIREANRPPFTLNALWQALRRPLVGPLLHSRFFFGMAFATFQTIFTLYAQYRFGLGSQQTGYILAYVGLLSVITQGFVIGRLAKRFSENNLLFAGCAMLAVSFLGWAFTPSIPLLLVIMIPIALSGGILNTVINSAITKAVVPVEIGGMLGLSASLESLTRVIAPSLAGVLLQVVGPAAPGIFSSILMLALTSYVWRNIIHSQLTTLSTDPVS